MDATLADLDPAIPPLVRQLLEEEGLNLKSPPCGSRWRQFLHRLGQALSAADERGHGQASLVASLSHDLRTPLNGIIGMVGLLADTSLLPEQREYVETIYTCADDLLSLVTDVVDHAKIGADRLIMEDVDFGLPDVLEDTVCQVAPRAHQKGLEIALLLPGDLPRVVGGDPGRLQQVLLHLLGNAIKFTEQGEVVLRARVIDERRSAPLRAIDSAPSMAATEDAARCLLSFEVTDTGVGIAPEHAARLLRGVPVRNTATTRVHGGAGLGLCLSYHLVARMGGRIQLTSQPGQGTTVRFTARLRRLVTDAAVEVPGGVGRAGLLRALCVDNSAAARLAVQGQLQGLGLECDVAEDAPRGFAQLRAALSRGRPYHVALLDRHMPGMDGLALSRMIKGDPELSSMAVLMLTTTVNRLSAEDARRAGLSGSLIKPVRAAELGAAIGAALSGVTSERDEAPEGARARILLAEDNPVNRKLAVLMLDKLGCQVDAVADGQQALSAQGRAYYDVVLMDCQMPTMDGYEATQRIRQREGGERRVPIIALTAQQGDQAQCRAAGMDDYLPKPLKLDALKRMLSRWLPQRRGGAWGPL